MQLSLLQKLWAWLLTIVQYACLALFLYWSPWKADEWLILPEILGILLGLYSIFVMRKSKLEISPMPKEGANLIQKGPYKLIRHPMYAAILLTFLPLLISHFSWQLFAVFAVLTLNLLVKMHYEEKLLLKKFYDYRQYSEKTRYLIPFIY